MDLIQPEYLGSCLKSITTDLETIIQVEDNNPNVEKLIQDLRDQIENTKNPNEVIRLERRLGRISAKVAIV